VRLFWRWTGAIFFALVFVFLVVTGIGTSLPIDHHASCFATFEEPAGYLFAKIADDGTSTLWRPDLSSAVLIAGSGPTAVWQETDKHGRSLTYHTTMYVQGKMLARSVDYVPGMSFAGTWTFEIAPDRTSPMPQHGQLPAKSMFGQLLVDAMKRSTGAEYGPASPTRVTITEDGKIYNPFFRFMARYAFGYTASLQTYLDDLRLLTGQNSTISCDV
jgi:hypothetical protein